MPLLQACTGQYSRYLRLFLSFEIKKKNDEITNKDTPLDMPVKPILRQNNQYSTIVGGIHPAK